MLASRAPSARNAFKLSMGYNIVVDTGEAPPAAPPKAVEAPVRQVPRGMVIKMHEELRNAIFARASAHCGERATLRKAFADFDADKSGYIDKKEFCRALERFGLHTADFGRKGVGGLGNEVVEYAIVKRSRTHHTHCRLLCQASDLVSNPFAHSALFASFDRDSSGTLDYNEFEEMLLPR